jgi:hypothetical protein
MKPYLKAAVAFLTAFLGSLSGALTLDDSLTLAAWITAASFGVVAFGGVFYTPYASTVKPKAKPKA